MNSKTSSIPTAPTESRDFPLTDLQCGQIRERVLEDLHRAGQIINLALPDLPVRFDLSGTAAGMYCRRGPDHWLRFNPWQFAANFELHLKDTVTHEVAHYAIGQLLPRRRVKPHGPEWRGLMIALGANPSATFKADMSGVPVRRQQRHRYHCGCREHAVSSTRHNRVLRQRAQYRCRYCNGVLTPI